MREWSLSRRRFLQGLGGAGLLAAAYHPLVSSGLFRIPRAVAQELPTLPPGDGRRVGIVGAGVAGLTAAYELARAGYDVTIYEGDDRYGGRSLTVRPSDEGYKSWFLDTNPFVTEASYVDTVPGEVKGAGVGPQPVDIQVVRQGNGYFPLWLNLGPGRIPTHHTGILHYCRLLGVEMEPYIFVSEANRMQAEGFNGGAPIQIRQFQYNMQGYLGEMLAALSEQALPIADPNASARSLELFRRFLAEYGDLDASGAFTVTDRAGYVVNPGAGTNSGELRPPIAMEDLLQAEGLWPGMLNQDAYEWQTSLLQPVGGMDMIWQAFLAQTIDGAPLRDLVRLSNEVTGMSYDPDGRVVLSVDTPDGPITTEPFDYVICTAQPAITAAMAIEGVVEDDAVAALKSVLYMNGGKYGWQGRTRFWEAQDVQIFGGISWTTHLIEQIWYPSEGYNGPTGMLTGGYIHDVNAVDAEGFVYTAATDYETPFPPSDIPEDQKNATVWAGLSQEERTSQALMGGEALHPGFTENVYSQNGLSIAWQNQPYQMGIGTYDMPGSRPDAYARLIRPIDRMERVYLAGDYVSYWTGWQEGSVRSVWWTLGLMAKHMAGAR
ncbi:FAD-dependent oxidoreductase [Salinarimonas sp.]|uniref:flavin monoamine oxidase family protein n=1 Tax=Salinarimonas sp. TaxID=2766526 RepID=UPI0032D99C8C